MIELPAGLAPWSEQLALLPNDLALALAPWVGRLSLAVGPLSVSARSDAGEPDGYSGLRRRGSYERLVTTEWAIAEQFPDEFLRRAAGGEHLFFHLARHEPRTALRSVAIVSAGPSQLGAPRLAHIAALIVLARRAAAAGAPFAWGILEDAAYRLETGLDAAGIQRLLGARTAVAAEPAWIGAWRDKLGESTTDFWFIGGDEDARSATQLGASRMTVRDVLVPSVRALDVEVERRGTKAFVRLDLPAADTCVRLLRDPYTRGAPRIARAKSHARALRFAGGGRKLIVQLADGAFEAWPIPSSPRDQPGHPRRWEPPRNGTVVAVGVGKRSVLAATASLDDTTVLELHYSHNHSIRLMLPKTLAAELGAHLSTGERISPGTCALVKLREGAGYDLVLSVLDRLLVVPGFELWPPRGFSLTAFPLNGTIDNLGPYALATGFFHSSLVWAEQHENGQIHIVEATGSGNQRMKVIGARGEPDVQFGFAWPLHTGWGVVSVAWDQQHRRVAAPKLEPVSIKSVVPVVGVCLRDGVPWLLTKPNPFRLAWLDGDHRDLLPTATSPIVAVAVCNSKPQVAWLTESGEVTLYSADRKEVVFRRLATEEP